MTPQELDEWLGTHCAFCGEPLDVCNETDCPVAEKMIREFDEAVAAGDILLTALPEENDCE